MNKSTVLKIIGAVGIVGGSVALFLGGVGQDVAITVVEGAFVLAGIIAGLFGFKK